MDSFGLSLRVADLVRQVLAAFPEVEKAVIYGSRAKGTYRLGSDIDLALFGVGLTYDILGKIASRSDESPIPHTVDLSLYAELNHPELREFIDRVDRTFYARGGVEYEPGAVGKVRDIIIK